MKLIQIIKVSLRNIANNRLRSILTMLGLIIGISSVIVLVGISDGSSKAVTSKVQSLGTDILTININSKDYSIDYSDLDEIKELSNVAAVTPYKNLSKNVNRGSSTSQGASLVATNDNFLEVRNLTLAKRKDNIYY